MAAQAAAQATTKNQRQALVFCCPFSDRDT
jgi:hypothetical protein